MNELTVDKNLLWADFPLGADVANRGIKNVPMALWGGGAPVFKNGMFSRPDSGNNFLYASQANSHNVDGGNLTYSCAFHALSLTGYQHVWGLYSAAGNKDYESWVILLNGTSLMVELCDNVKYFSSGTLAVGLVPNKLYVVHVVVPLSGYPMVYLDGQLIHTFTTAYGGNYTTHAYGGCLSVAATIRGPSDYKGNYFNGYVGACRIYNKLLSAKEIAVQAHSVLGRRGIICG